MGKKIHRFRPKVRPRPPTKAIRPVSEAEGLATARRRDELRRRLAKFDDKPNDDTNRKAIAATIRAYIAELELALKIPPGLAVLEVRAGEFWFTVSVEGKEKNRFTIATEAEALGKELEAEGATVELGVDDLRDRVEVVWGIRSETPTHRKAALLGFLSGRQSLL